MAALKLYLLLVTKDEPVQLTVHRDLLTLEDAWANCDQVSTAGVVHIGFIRPKIKNADAILKHCGKILVTVAAKWALPEGCRSSRAAIAEIKLSNQIIPLHQLFQGLGCDEVEPDAGFEPVMSVSSIDSGYTITEAAEHVLNKATSPLNKEEVFARIIEGGLYQFGAKKPVSVLAVELNRYSRGTEYSSAATVPLFQKTPDDRYYSLANEPKELSGWVKKLEEIDAEIAHSAGSYGIVSEESYVNFAQHLPAILRNQLDAYRFNILLASINSRDPEAVIRILPESLLTAVLSSIDMPIRVLNVLNVRGIQCLSDLSGTSVDEMLGWPNFGRKSVGDFCDSMIQAVEKLSEHVDGAKVIDRGDGSILGFDEDNKLEEEAEFDEAHQVKIVSAKPLKAHYQATLARLKDKDRRIIEYRTGIDGEVMTLEAVGQLMGVTRERIRQIQKKYVEKIIETEYWDDCIALKIGQLLIARSAPLYIEMLEVEDSWFSGFMGNYQHLAAIIELFSENEIRVVRINGATVVTRIKSDLWEQLVRHLRKSLKDKAADGGWTRQDIEMTFSSALLENGASELLTLLWDEFGDTLQFDGESAESKLIGYGKSAESAVAAVLAKAEKPLHYSEITKRATEIYGKEVSERLTHNAAPRLGAKLFAPGTHGLPHHNPISERMCKNLQLVVSKMIASGPLMKQWHCSEIITKLKEQFSALPEELDHFILNMILDGVDDLSYLNRMVWARADSGQTKYDRVSMSDAFTKILEDNGGPLKGNELKRRLQKIRGVVDGLQIQPTGRMIQIGPDYWGLMDRDVGGGSVNNQENLDQLYSVLKDRQKGIHVSEVDQFVAVSDSSPDFPSAYALLNLAQRDERFHLGRSMFVGLAEWEGDTRRLNTSQAVRKVLEGMSMPISIAKIGLLVEDLTEMQIDTQLSNVLISEGAVYDQFTKTWYKS